MMDDQIPKRGKGRPPKLKTCVRCRELGRPAEKRRRDYDNGRDDLCSFCKHEIRTAGGPRGVQASDLVPSGQPDVPSFVPMKPMMRENLTDMIRLGAMNAQLAKLIEPLPRCCCCWELRHVALDSYGGVALVCRRCEHQILSTGACHLHHGKMYYPELAPSGPVGPVPSPPEIEALFYVRESEKPKYDAAELADADV